MDVKQLNKSRTELNELMSKHDAFFSDFGDLDDKLYAEGAIPKKYKELTGLSISILSKCEECILFHLQNCIKEMATKNEIIEAIKLGTIAGGSVCYPSARYAFKVMQSLGVI